MTTSTTATTTTTTTTTKTSFVWFFYAFTRATRAAIAVVYASAFGVVLREMNGRTWDDDDYDGIVRALGGFMCAYALTYYALLWNQSCVALEALREARRRDEDEEVDVARGGGKTRRRTNKIEAPTTLFDIKYGARKTPAYVTAERSVGNFIEQSLALLPALLFHTFVMRKLHGICIAYSWLIVRWLYPWSFARGFGWFTHLQTPVFLFVTFPNYIAIGALYRDIARYSGLINS